LSLSSFPGLSPVTSQQSRSMFASVASSSFSSRGGGARTFESGINVYDFDFRYFQRKNGDFLLSFLGPPQVPPVNGSGGIFTKS
jgi:hypothetical protein